MPLKVLFLVKKKHAASNDKNSKGNVIAKETKCSIPRILKHKAKMTQAINRIPIPFTIPPPTIITLCRYGKD